MMIRQQYLDWVSPVLLGLGALVILLALGQFWGVNPGYADRFLIVLGAAYAAWLYRPQFFTIEPTPRAWFGSLCLLFGIAAFPLGVFLLQQIGPRTLLLWWLTIAWFIACVGWLLAEHGYSRTRLMAFPLLFIFFALPIPLRILNPLQDNLQHITTWIAFQVFTLFQSNVVRQGYVITLPGGMLGVEEACSGIRSLTALTALSAFLAFWNGFGPIRGGFLVVGSIPIVVMVNLLRVLLSGLIQEAFGADYIKGAWHEALGFAMVFVGLALIMVLASTMTADQEPEQPVELPSYPHRRSWLAILLLTLGLISSGCLAYLGQANLQQLEAFAPIGEIPLSIGTWQGQNMPIPPEVHDLLAPDVALHRQYRNSLGQEANVWAFVWNSGAAIRGYHHPDVCWGNKGFVPVDKWEQPLQVDGSNFKVVGREFRQKSSKQIIFYWTQEGNYVWGPLDEAAAESDMINVTASGHRWVIDLLTRRNAERGPRVTLLVMLPGGSNSVRRDAVELSTQLAQELHRIAPWSKP
jgi:exosortase